MDRFIDKPKIRTMEFMDRIYSDDRDKMKLQYSSGLDRILGTPLFVSKERTHEIRYSKRSRPGFLVH